MLERLKSLFRPKGPEVEYRRPEEPEGTELPAGPLTGTTPTMAPRNDPAAEAATDDDERP